MAEEDLQENQGRKSCIGRRTVERNLPVFYSKQASSFKDKAQTSAIEIQPDLLAQAGDGRSCQAPFEDGSDMQEKGRKILDTEIPGIRRLFGTI
jgi:hypothetical protein